MNRANFLGPYNSMRWKRHGPGTETRDRSGHTQKRVALAEGMLALLAQHILADLAAHSARRRE